MLLNKHPLWFTKPCLTSFPLVQSSSRALWPLQVPFHSSIVGFFSTVELFLRWSALCSPAGCTERTDSLVFSSWNPTSSHWTPGRIGRPSDPRESHAVTQKLKTAGTAGTFTLGHLTSQQNKQHFKKTCPLNQLLWEMSSCLPPKTRTHHTIITTDFHFFTM